MGYARSYKGAGVSPRPDGTYAFADPGFQADRKMRFPVDSPEHVLAAYRYINDPDNAAKYDSGQLVTIKSNISSAMRKHSIDPYVEAGRAVMEAQPQPPEEEA